MKNKSISRKWMRSILIVVMAMFLVFLMLCLYLLQHLRSSTLQTSRDMALYIKSNSDSRFLEIQKNINLLAIDPITSQLKKLDKQPDASKSGIYNFCNRLDDFRITHNLVEHILIYYPKIDVVTGSMGYYTANQYSRLLQIRHQNLSSIGSYWNLPREESNFILQDGRLFYTYELLNESELSGIIIIELSLPELLNGFQGSDWNSLSNITTFGLIVNETPIHTDSLNEINPSSDFILTNPEQESLSIVQNDILIYRLTSVFPNLQYFVGYQENSLFRPLYLAFAFCSTGLVLCLLFGIFSSIIISNNHARPVKDLLTKLSGTSLTASELFVDDFDYIEQQIDTLLDERHINIEKIDKQQNIIDDLFLNNLLQGNMHSEYIIFQEAGTHNILFEYPIFQIIVIHPPVNASDANQLILKYCRTNNWESMLGSVRGNIVLLFNTECPYAPGKLCDMAETMLSSLWPEEQVKYGIGRGYEHLVDIYTSYSEALSALALASSDLAVGHFFQENSITKPSLLHDVPDSLYKFMDAMKSGHFIQARDYLEQLFQNYIDSVNNDYRLQLRRINAIQNFLCDYIKLYKPTIPSPDTIFNMLYNDLPPAQLRTLMEELLDFLNDNLLAETSSHASIVERAKIFINNNLTNPMLGLYMVSEHLGVSNTYLSSNFKKICSIGVVQYINKLRIDKARSLILSTDYKIKDIALLVGFNSDISFIRVFKQYENCTPASLRKN